MNLSIDVDGNEEVARHFTNRSKAMLGAVQNIISKVALNVERFGKTYSPVDTGLMRSTIYPVSIRTNEAWVGPKTFYAKYVHARIPFMTAARESTIPTLPSIIKQEVEKAIK